MTSSIKPLAVRMSIVPPDHIVLDIGIAALRYMAWLS
jgi:hypothetical protein